MTGASVQPKSVFISAGEQSGDLHGSELMKRLKELQRQDIIFNGLGGDLMKSEGLSELYHTKDLATIGFADVIKKYSFFKKAINDCIEYIRNNNPDVVVLIDYPGFNIRLAEGIRRFYNKKIIYYISPQLWAWHEKRVYKIKKYVDKMLVLFPFEVDFYKKFGVDAEYVGHPLENRIKKYLEDNPKRRKPDENKKVITILPGSRKDEISQHMPVLIETVKLLKNEVDLDVNISKAPGLDEKLFENYAGIKEYNLTGETVYNLVNNSDLVLTKAGTSTMECSLIGTPYLIFYKTFPLNYYLLKPIVKVNNLGIANILSGKNIIKEFIQKDFTAENLAGESKKILSDAVYRNEMINNLSKIWDILGNHDASFNSAKIIKELALT